MTALELYKFINENDIEWRWETRIDTGERDVIMFPSAYIVEDFSELLSPTSFDDGGINCVMMDGYFAFWMNDICEHYGIKLEEIFKPE